MAIEELEVGKFYTNEAGNVVKIIEYTDDRDTKYPYKGDNEEWYTTDGHFWSGDDCKEDPRNLVKEFIAGETEKEFSKADHNKPMLSLIEPQFIISLGEIMTFGANKYSIDNWKLCTDTRRYKDALLRHTYAYLSGEIIDPESGIPHTACIAFNTMALQWFDNNHV